VRLKQANNGEKREIELHGIFVAIGHTPIPWRFAQTGNG